jgi:hypothetical protein
VTLLQQRLKKKLQGCSLAVKVLVNAVGAFVVSVPVIVVVSGLMNAAESGWSGWWHGVELVTERWDFYVIIPLMVAVQTIYQERPSSKRPLLIAAMAGCVLGRWLTPSCSG